MARWRRGAIPNEIVIRVLRAPQPEDRRGKAEDVSITFEVPPRSDDIDAAARGHSDAEFVEAVRALARQRPANEPQHAPPARTPGEPTWS